MQALNPEDQILRQATVHARPERHRARPGVGRTGSGCSCLRVVDAAGLEDPQLAAEGRISMRALGNSRSDEATTGRGLRTTLPCAQGGDRRDRRHRVDDSRVADHSVEGRKVSTTPPRGRFLPHGNPTERSVYAAPVTLGPLYCLPHNDPTTNEYLYKRISLRTKQRQTK